MKKGLVTFVLASTLVGLTGCADNATKNNLRNDVNNGVDVRNVRNNLDNRLSVQNVNDNNHNLRYSNRAGRAVEKLQEVDLAHVIIRNNNAYVAVRLKNNRFQTGTGTTTNRNNMGTTSINNNLGTTGTNGRENHLTARGAGTSLNGNYPSTTGVTTIDNTATGLNPGAGGTSNTRGTIGIRGTGTFGTLNNNNIFTGTNDGTAGTNDGTTATNYRSVSSPLDQRIADQVRKADSAVHRVYISYDRAFFRQMTNYSNDLNTKGRIRNNNIWNDFNNSVNRIFH
ncbi:YhcN/YlaJ family sporulation lipoprotein [Neobacillus drentensis]|uniref:YhcN/YlaJ family sporulation lipoprotein n=1 Tax=Neobacillus drentensis TaxID=220684 RepID=UPI002FFF64B9